MIPKSNKQLNPISTGGGADSAPPAGFCFITPEKKKIGR